MLISLILFEIVLVQEVGVPMLVVMVVVSLIILTHRLVSGRLTYVFGCVLVDLMIAICILITIFFCNCQGI